MALTRPRFGQLNTGVIETADPITVLNQGATSANTDVGFLFNRGGGLVSNVALYWSESAKSFVTSFTNNGGENGNVTVSSYANLSVGNVLLVNGGILNVTGNIEGNTTGTHFGSIVADSIQWANGQPILTSVDSIVSTANTSLKNYVDAQNTSITNDWTANAVTQLSQIAGANAAIITANTALKSYVDDRDIAITNSWTANAVTQQGQIATLQSQVYTNSNVDAYLNSSGAGNISISGGSFALTATGPGATTVGSATAIPVITTDAYGRISALSTASVSSTLNLAGTTGTGTVSLTSQSLTFAGSYGVTASASNQTITVATPQDLRISASPSFVGGNFSGSVYAGALYDNGARVVSTSAGAGNLTISGTGINLTATGPGASTWGGATGSNVIIPVLSTDAYGRISTASNLTLNITSTIAGTGGTTGAIAQGQIFTFTSTNGMVLTASGNTLAISTPQNLQTAASPTFAGLTTSGNTIINSTAYVSGITRVTNSTASTGAGNGALVVTGGLGVSGTSNFGADLYVTGNIYTANLIAESTSTLNTSSPMVYFQATPYPYNFETGFYSHFVGGPANVYSHTGFVRNHNNGYWALFSNVASEPSSTTINFADTGIIYDTLQAGGLILSNSTASTSTTTGALVVNGGAGISGNLNVNSAGYFGYNASQISLLNPSIIGTQSSQAVDAGQYYVQMALVNTNGTGSADITSYPNNVTDGSSAFMDMGFTGNLFSDPAYTITKANDGYLFASALTGSGLGGNLVLATDKTGTHNDIVIATGSFFANAEVARFSGNATTSGYLQLTTGASASSTTTGALRVTGGVGVSGNVYANALYTTTGLRWAGNNTPFSSGGGATYTAATTPPATPTVGDQWYNTTNDVLYEFQDVGTGSFWIDTSSPQVVSGDVTIPGSDGISPFLLMGA